MGKTIGCLGIIVLVAVALFIASVNAANDYKVSPDAPSPPSPNSTTRGGNDRVPRDCLAPHPYLRLADATSRGALDDQHAR